MIDDKNKVIFIHIPKCAGTSILHSIDPSYKDSQWDPVRKIHVQHATARQYRNIYAGEEKFASYLKIAFIRNPFDRLVSAYAYLKKRTGCEDSFENFFHCRGSFQLMMDNQDPSSIFHLLMRHTSAYDYLYENGNCLVDVIGRFEHLHRDWNRIRERHGLSYPPIVKHHNKSIHMRYRKYYNGELRDLATDRFKKDMEVFGYKF